MRTYTSNELGYMGEDNLADLVRREKRHLERLKRSGDKQSAQKVEENICYVQREIKIREAMKKAHAEYLNQKSRKNRARY